MLAFSKAYRGHCRVRSPRDRSSGPPCGATQLAAPANSSKRQVPPSAPPAAALHLRHDGAAEGCAAPAARRARRGARPGRCGCVTSAARRRRPAPLLDACRDGRNLRIRVGAGILRIRDQPLDPPALDLVGRATAFDFRQPPARGRAHVWTEGKCWRFYPPADPLQAALRLAPLIAPMIDLIQSAPAIQSARSSRRLGPLRRARRWSQSPSAGYARQPSKGRCRSAWLPA